MDSPRIQFVDKPEAMMYVPVQKDLDPTIYCGNVTSDSASGSDFHMFFLMELRFPLFASLPFTISGTKKSLSTGSSFCGGLAFFCDLWENPPKYGDSYYVISPSDLN